MKNYNNHDEIDLRELISQLWANRVIIFIITLLFLMMGCLYFALAKPKWTSNALIALPELGQLSNYPEGVSLSLSNQTDSYDNNLSTKVFNVFLANVDAVIERDKPSSPVSITKPKDANYYILSFSSSNAKLAQSGLTDLVAFLNKRTQETLYKTIHQSLDHRKQSLQQRIKALEASAQEKKQQRLKLLNSALRIAQNTQLNTNEITQLPNVIPDDALFMMGVPALEALIKQAQDWPLSFEQRYFDDQVWLSLLSSFQLNDARFQAVNVISPPSLAKYRDNPKITLILVLSLILGGIAGVAYVLIRQSFMSLTPRLPSPSSIDGDKE